MVVPKRKDFFRKFSQENFHYDWVLLTVIIILCVAGLAFLASGLSSKGQLVYQQQFLKQLLFGVWIGSTVAFVLSKIDYHFWFKHSRGLLIFTFALLVFLGVFSAYADIIGVSHRSVVERVKFLPISPYEANGSIRWINLPQPLPNFQPVEFAKLAILIYFADFLNKNDKEKYTWLKLKRPFYVFILMASLIIIQPDLGSILLIFGILLSAMWVAKVPTRILGPITIGVILVGAAFIYYTPYRRSRLDSDSSFQITQVRLAVQNGGLWGKGYGNSEFKQANQIPESTTDGIIGIIGEEMGFVFIVAFLCLYLMILIRGVKIANEAPDTGGKTLAIGISVWIVSQAFLNVAGITGLIPLKGLPLPFVSAGGSAIILNLMAIGILLNISHQRIITKKYEKIKTLNSKLNLSISK